MIRDISRTLNVLVNGSVICNINELMKMQSVGFLEECF